jgi:hypothetical protein
MSTTEERLDLYAAILCLIDRKRAETGDNSLGETIEHAVIQSQFTEIDHQILESSDPFEPGLFQFRRGEA